MCVAVSTVDHTLPLFFVFPQVYYKNHFILSPHGSLGGANPFEWMNSENFLNFLKHFVDQVRPSREKPIFLLLDNHESHLSIDALNFTKDNGIVMLPFLYLVHIKCTCCGYKENIFCKTLLYHISHIYRIIL